MIGDVGNCGNCDSDDNDTDNEDAKVYTEHFQYSSTLQNKSKNYSRLNIFFSIITSDLNHNFFEFTN